MGYDTYIDSMNFQKDSWSTYLHLKNDKRNENSDKEQIPSNSGGEDSKENIVKDSGSNNSTTDIKENNDGIDTKHDPNESNNNQGKGLTEEEQNRLRTVAKQIIKKK